MLKFFSRNLLWFLLALLILLLDQISKQMALAHLADYEPQELLPFLNFYLAHNTGAAWNFLSNAGGWQRWFFIAVAIGISAMLVAWLIRLPQRAYAMTIGLALILGGALGNLWDRIAYGHVIDFIQVHAGHWYFPTFNIADSAITIGAVILLIQAVFGKE